MGYKYFTYLRTMWHEFWIWFNLGSTAHLQFDLLAHKGNMETPMDLFGGLSYTAESEAVSEIVPETLHANAGDIKYNSDFSSRFTRSSNPSLSTDFRSMVKEG